ncbi:hypothetical protein NIES25_45960 [Nostoc linckia NIES-25]|nr:hypothetical protein NIES25_45960 [Nostoc linckia NIES-25]
MRVPEVFCRSPVGVLANGRIMVWAYPKLRLFIKLFLLLNSAVLFCFNQIAWLLDWE